MPGKTVWTEGQDGQIRRLRTEGASWDVIAALLGLARCTVIERARRLGVEHPPAHAAASSEDLDRGPLPSGHPTSWKAINRDTVLKDVPFRIPSAIR